MSTLNLAFGLPNVSSTNGVCASYDIVKQHQYPFPKEKYLCASTSLESVHNDLISFPNHFFRASVITKKLII